MTRKSVIGYRGAALLGGAAAGVGAGVGLLFGAITWEAIRGARPLTTDPTTSWHHRLNAWPGTVLTADGTRLNVVTYGPSAGAGRSGRDRVRARMDVHHRVLESAAEPPARRQFRRSHRGGLRPAWARPQ